MCHDIAYVVQQVCLYMHDPRKPHHALVKHVLDLVAYSNANRAGCLDTHCSTSGYGVFLEDNLISSSCKRQPTVSRSSDEAEYRAVANAVTETTWLRQLLGELHSSIRRATLVYCDNVSDVYLSTNLVQHQCTKHFVRDKVAAGAMCVLHVPTVTLCVSNPHDYVNHMFKRP
jgi:hypothetical protein